MAITEPQTVDLVRMQDKLGYQFKEPALLIQALTHPSYVNELPNNTEDDNQRLEFLGDAILGFLVGEWLFNRYPGAREGELTSLRAHLVRTESLAGFAREMAVGQFMRFGRGERVSGGARREANLCAAFEAIVGAVFLDSDMNTARAWLYTLLAPRAKDIDDHRRTRDPKSHLQEFVQGRYKITPTYSIIASEGPDHAKQFTSEVSIDGQPWGRGTGFSKQAAEQSAAAAALARIDTEDQAG
ncbi:MAG: ribonuclease III [Chloroflexi bacterium]|nr:ribonuclease III [Chloroflexota bacterium]